MIARVLHPVDYPRLLETEGGSLFWPDKLPAGIRMIVVEDDTGAIVGCHGLMLVLHAEGLWVDEAHRGRTAVVRRLWPAVKNEARNYFHATGFVTGADAGTMGDPVREILDHLGARRLPDQYIVDVET